jgi:hypothetical protein
VPQQQCVQAVSIIHQVLTVTRLAAAAAAAEEEEPKRQKCTMGVWQQSSGLCAETTKAHCNPLHAL